MNLHGDVDLETGATRMIELTEVDAASTLPIFGFSRRKGIP